MADLIEEMRSGPCALLIGYAVIGLSLCTLGVHTVERFTVEAVSRAPITATLARNSVSVEIEKHARASTRLGAEAPRISHSTAFLPTLNSNLKLGGTTPSDSLKADDVAARRKAAFALLVFAAVESVRGAPG